MTECNKQVHQLRVLLTLPNPCNSESSFRNTFHDNIKNTVMKIFSKPSLLQASRSGIEAPIWNLDCQVQLSNSMAVRSARKKIRNDLVKCLKDLLPFEECQRFEKALTKQLQVREGSEPFNDNAC